MPEIPSKLAERLQSLILPGARQRLVARGLARGMIWRAGQLPPDAPPFSSELTFDLLDHGFAILAMALRLRDSGQFSEVVEQALSVAAESIESAVRKASADDADRGFHLIVAATAFHIGHFAARSYCLLQEDIRELNLSFAEQMLAALIRRSFGGLKTMIIDWLRAEEHQDDAVAARLENDPNFSEQEAAVLAFTETFCRVMAWFTHALESGSEEAFGNARQLLLDGIEAAAERNFVPQWWVYTLTRHLLDDLWDQSLHNRLPVVPDDSNDQWNRLRRDFIRSLYLRKNGEIDLWPSQLEAAARTLDETDNLVVALPTSAGKTRIAELAILRCLAGGRRVIYVTPLRALSAQVERVLSRTFSPLGISVSALYGASGVAVADIDALESYRIVVATPEKLDFAIRQQPSVLDDVGLVVLDEGHMIGLGSREVRYEVLVQRLLRRSDASTRRLVCLSAMFASGEPFQDFTSWLRRDEAGTGIELSWRPTRQRPGVLLWGSDAGRLELSVDGETPWVPRFVRQLKAQKPRQNLVPNNNNELLLSAAQAFIKDDMRVLVYCPLRKSVETMAKLVLSLHKIAAFPALLDDDDRIKRAIFVGEEWLGADHVAVKALRLGVAVHHAGLPRPFLAELEALLADKDLKMVVASPTLAQGVDLSCSALLFQSIYRNSTTIPPDEFANVIGRAGRAYVDLDGIAVYPIFEKSEQKKRMKKFYGLLKDSRERTMESGILLLVDQLANILAEKLGIGVDGVLEYVLNETGPWVKRVAGAGKEDIKRDDGIESDLADLDVAILATIDDLECTAADVANQLDAALTSSLWRRRLDKKSTEEQKVQENIIKARASWIWSKTDGGQRKGFFAAGVGYETGIFIDLHIDELVSNLISAEAGLLASDSGIFVDSILALAERLFSVMPFGKTERPSEWKEVLRGWIADVPVSQLIQLYGDDVTDFIQDGLVYRLVWAIEAVRVHGIAQEKIESDGIGIAGLALTYGASTITSCFLLDAGFPSRVMATKLLLSFPANFENRREFRKWMEEVIGNLKPGTFWIDEGSRRLWMEFLSRWGARRGNRWRKVSHKLEVEWASEPPSDEVDLRIVHDAARNATFVFSADLTLLGKLSEAFPEISKCHARAAVSGDQNIIKVRLFGPGL